jgi:Putative metallopeptidase
LSPRDVQQVMQFIRRKGAQMSSMVRMVALAAAFATASLVAQPASAQIPPELKNAKISFAYVPPESPKLQPIMERLKNRQLLEKLAAFLSPLQLPHAFYLVARECQEPNAFYNPTAWRIDICYEMIELIEKVAPGPNLPVDGFTRDEVVVGAFVGVIIHEVGHAAFDMFNVPVFGREEDAADEMAGFLAVQFNKQVARTVTRGFAYLWQAAGRMGGEPKDWAEYSDEHGANQQRYYNVLCMGYGADPQHFKDFIDKGWLPKERAAGCAAEYQQVRHAFSKTVLPFINQSLIKKVQETDWLK